MSPLPIDMKVSVTKDGRLNRCAESAQNHSSLHDLLQQLLRLGLTLGLGNQVLALQRLHRP
jgi:hypothetical protein